MNWTAEQILEAYRRFNAGKLQDVMDYAAELLAARSASGLLEFFDMRWAATFGDAYVMPRGQIRDRILETTASHAAEVATLREKVAALEEVAGKRWRECQEMDDTIKSLRAELARLKPSGQVAELVAILEAEIKRGPDFVVGGRSRDALHAALTELAILAQEAQEAKNCPDTRADAELVRKALAGSGVENVRPAFERIATVAGLAAQWKAEACEARRHMPEVDGLTPYEKCLAGTCGHEDAGKPGHADRVREASRAFNEAVRCICPPNRDGVGHFGSCPLWMEPVKAPVLALVPDDEGAAP